MPDKTAFTVAPDQTLIPTLHKELVGGAYAPAMVPIGLDGQPVGVGGAAGAGLTDAQLRATPVPVGGAFYPATQPVSALALPLPTGAATEASVSALAQQGAPITGQVLESGGSAVLGWLASIRKAVADRLPAALVNGRLDVNLGASTTIPVSGTFFQATQPVSAATLPLPVGAATEATLAARLATPTAKGTQGATAQPTQDLKDSGRARVSIKATAVAGATTETLVSLVKTTNGVEATGATTIPVAAGKTLRLTTMVVTWRNATAALGAVQVRLRENPAGAALVSSPVVLTAGVRSAAATVGDVATVVVPLPDGVEFSGPAQLAVSQVAIGAVVGFDVQLLVLEY